MEDKNSQRCYFAWENLQWGFCEFLWCRLQLFIHFCSSFCFCSSSFIFVLHLLMFFIHICFLTSSLTPFRGLSAGFYTHFILSAQPIAGVFYCSFTDILPAIIKASLWAGSSSLKFPGFHTDPRNTDPAHLFVWFTVIHNLHIQNDSVLNSTIYYHELLVVKV